MWCTIFPMNDAENVPSASAGTEGSDPQTTDAVDPAALGLVALVVVFTFATGAGDWEPFSTVVGLALILALLAYHRTSPVRTRTLQTDIRRWAFASFLALSIGLALAWPLQMLILQPQDPTYLGDIGEHRAAEQTTWVLAGLWIPFTIVLALFEPSLSRGLSRTRPGRGRAAQATSESSRT